MLNRRVRSMGKSAPKNVNSAEPVRVSSLGGSAKRKGDISVSAKPASRLYWEAGTAFSGLPLSHHRYVAGDPAIPKHEVTRIHLTVPIGIQSPQEPLAENSDLGDSRSLPIANDRYITGDSSIRKYRICRVQRAIPVSIQSPQEALPEIPDLRAAIAVPVSDDWNISWRLSNMQVEHRISRVQCPVPV